MRLLRMAAVLIFIAALALNILATVRHKAEQDTVPPVIHCPEGALELSVQDGLEGLTKGLTATDDRDGDITDRILLASTSYFSEPGTTNVSYVVFDSGHNSHQISRNVVFTDYESPRFSLSQPLVFYRGQNIRFLNYIFAKDCLDGDITGKIKVVASNVSNYTTGIYPILLEVTNSFGDRVEIELMVVVQAETHAAPEIALKEYITYVKTGESFDPYSLIASVRAFGTGETISKDAVSVLGSVDTETPGFYHLIFTCQDNGAEGSAYLTVVVTEG